MTSPLSTPADGQAIREGADGRCGGQQACARGHKVTVYRDDSTVQVVYERVKSVFWTAANTVLVVARWDADEGDAHHYIHWPRERFCWFKEEHHG